ncbi:antibiotic biosynthesis monooxygenase [Putridiphycobacter roseus]|uniref:Antibiotic biosynthesis monooxygenase n=1 Tax=Putridiphycobacter roseus TaxID=2219161 RepID=A0A2W1NE96_9FLAO|nr:antibiotic biosynthesis monooxygenase [Putridiphycobacter roseus]PZE17423.1 antibiotic biosynthesis monooxygenase [Putridiphycobacter roseus]
MKNLIVKFTTKPEGREVFMEALLENRKGAQNEDGFVGMNLFEDTKNPNIIFAYDSWKDDTALEHHKQSVHALNMLKVAETTLACPPDVLLLNDTKPAPVPAKTPNAADELFIIFFIFKIKEGYKQRLIDRFEIHIENTRKEKGNLLFDLYTVDGQDDTLVVYEHWRTEADVWDIHMKQPYAEITGELMNEGVVGDLAPYMSFVKEI